MAKMIGINRMNVMANLYGKYAAERASVNLPIISFEEWYSNTYKEYSTVVGKLEEPQLIYAGDVNVCSRIAANSLPDNVLHGNYAYSITIPKGTRISVVLDKEK